MTKAAAAVIAALTLSACTPLTIAGSILATGISAYCAGASEAAKKHTRDTLTSGQRILACGDTP